MNSAINPVLSEQQQERVLNETQHWCKKASKIFDQNVDGIPVYFDLRGRTSGMFCTQGSEQWIRYNAWIFAKHFDASLAVTVPHEVAHYICHLLYGRQRTRPKPHGKEWRAIMAKFGVPANATCKLDISDLPQKRLRRFNYRCDCMTHQLTSIRHRRILNKQRRYFCPKCNTELRSTN